MPPRQRWSGYRTGLKPLIPLLMAIPLLGMVTGPQTARAQIQGKGAPTPLYRPAFWLMYDGNYKDALDQFTEQGRGAIKFGGQLWIDSICYLTMIGECHYQMGNLDLALKNYTAALNLYLQFPDWMNRLQWDTAQMRPVTTSPQTPWGTSTRGTQLRKYPLEISTMQGNLNAGQAFLRGGVVAPPMMYPVQPQEIVRATALAIRRRAELLGPLAKYDPLGQELVGALRQPVGPRTHWSYVWVDLQLGLAMLASEKESEAVSVLKRSVAAAGQFDHPLTGMALLSLGEVALKQGDYASAQKLFLEATYAAYHYGDYLALEEAFRGEALTHLLANQKREDVPLLAALRWTQANAQARDLRQLRASLAISAAENCLELGQTAQAEAMLAEAHAAIAKRTVAAGAVGARLSFVRATQLFQQRKIREGRDALAAAMAYLERGSRGLFHIAQVDAYVMNSQRKRELMSRRAMELYENVLRDPQPVDWGIDPMESLALLAVPHPLPLEHWFEESLRGVDEDVTPLRALEISDRLRRHRFLTTLPFGGRLLALRWILEAPDEALDRAALAQRQDLLARYPAYRAIAQQARQIRAKLASLPIAGGASDAWRQQSGLWAELAKLGLQQEAILCEIALRREPANLVFPPLRPTKEVQRALPEGAAMLSFLFLGAGRQCHAFLLNRNKCAHWTMQNPAALGARLGALLRGMGNYDANREVPAKDLASEEWKQTARQVLEAILKDSPADFTQPFAELVVVPDGILWYVPFEALQVSIDKQLHSLVSRFRIRYAPTVGLGVADARGRSIKPDTAVVVGRLFPRQPPDVTRAAFDQIAKVVPGAVAIDGPPPGGSAVQKWRPGHLIVLDDLVLSDQDPYDWSPMGLDRGKPGSTLADWMRLPWGGPEVIALPGYHTLAENPRRGTGPLGAEVFLSICGLLSTGTRTVLVSRWRTGGQSSFDLVREFVQELPRTSAADAWQRAVLLVQESRLNREAEPRVKFSAGEELKGAPPFFWAGYLLVDCGEPVEKRAAEAEKVLTEQEKAAQKQGAKKVPEAPGAEKPGAAKHTEKPGAANDAEKPGGDGKAAPPKAPEPKEVSPPADDRTEPPKPAAPKGRKPAKKTSR